MSSWYSSVRDDDSALAAEVDLEDDGNFDSSLSFEVAIYGQTGLMNNHGP